MSFPLTVRRKEYGASEGIRTLDIHLGKVTLYQLSYTRTMQAMPNLDHSRRRCKRIFSLPSDFLSSHRRHHPSKS